MYILAIVDRVRASFVRNWIHVHSRIVIADRWRPLVVTIVFSLIWNFSVLNSDGLIELNGFWSESVVNWLSTKHISYSSK